MKTNFKLSSKMHLLIIISCVVVAIGFAVGTICHFVANGFFNYGDDYASYKSVSVSYENIDFSGSGKEPVELIEDICGKAFKEAGITNYSCDNGDTTTGGKLVYRFVRSTDDAKLAGAVNAINAEIESSVVTGGGIQFSYASYHTADAVLGGGRAISMAAIAISAIIAFHFVYFVIRYKLSMALGALLADVHNLAVYFALLALCRVPLGSTVASFAVITLLLTVIGTCFYFDRVRKNAKEEELKKLTVHELADLSANESFMINTIMPACLAALSVVFFVLMSISSLSPLAILAPVLCSLVAFVSCVYGTVFFVPSVYSRINFKSADKSNSQSKK